jgi:hypothetical protein|tara:strand:- start:85 stop:882 length:798 start_codon:yes stop_codon:yes gene_type:complete
MFNHARTLLLNIAGSNSPGFSYLGEELVPADYAKITLPSYLENVRRPLFGAAPDRAMLNYRIRQLLTLIADTDLQEYITDLDSRITYLLGKDKVFTQHSTWDPVVSQYGGTADDIITLGGTPERPDFTGKAFYQFNVDILSSTVIQISRQAPPVKSQNLDLTLTGGLSAAYDLYYTGHTIRVNTINPGAAWTISGYLKPQLSLADIVAQLDSVGDDVLTELFGTKRIEPWNTFRNTWYDHPELPYRLGGLVLALIYRTNIAGGKS